MSHSATPHPKPGPLLVWLGHPFFSAFLEGEGWRVLRAPYRPGTVYTWDDILELSGGETPDVAVTADASAPPFVLGVEDFPCLTAFYVVDSHIHSWYPLYARAFDLCLVTLKEHLPEFGKGRLDSSRVWWTPPYARDEHRPPCPRPAKEWDMVFAGTVNKELAPARHAFLAEVKARFPGLHVTRETFPQVYPKARLILNESTRGELNYRVFEALGCGGCLLTPDIGPALREFFIPGKELFVYPPHDVSALLDLAHELLKNPARREAVAEAGLAAVDAGHRASARAGDFSRKTREILTSGQAGEIIATRRQSAPESLHDTLRLLYLHHAETVGIDHLRTIYLQAARKLKHLP